MSTMLDDCTKESLARISSIACLVPCVISNNDSSQTSTRRKKRVNKKKIFEKFMREEVKFRKAFEAQLQLDLDNFVLSCEMLKLSISSKYLNKTLQEFSFYNQMYAVNPNIEVSKENITVDENRCTDKHNRAFKTKTEFESISTLPHFEDSKLKTPKDKKILTPTLITPKMDLNQPVTIMRHARLGEQIISMTGSPVLVTSVPRGDTATVSIPFQDGNILTMMPSEEFNTNQMPLLDNKTKSQLQSLYENLSKLFTDDKN